MCQWWCNCGSCRLIECDGSRILSVMRCVSPCWDIHKNSCDSWYFVQPSIQSLPPDIARWWCSQLLSHLSVDAVGNCCKRKEVKRIVTAADMSDFKRLTHKKIQRILSSLSCQFRWRGSSSGNPFWDGLGIVWPQCKLFSAYFFFCTGEDTVEINVWT